MGEVNPLDYETAPPRSADDRIACWVYAILMTMFFGAAAWCGHKAAADDGMSGAAWIVFGAAPTAFFGLIFTGELWLSLRNRRNY
jgi:hypothetical protein